MNGNGKNLLNKFIDQRYFQGTLSIKMAKIWNMEAL